MKNLLTILIALTLTATANAGKGDGGGNFEGLSDEANQTVRQWLTSEEGQDFRSRKTTSGANMEARQIRRDFVTAYTAGANKFAAMDKLGLMPESLQHIPVNEVHRFKYMVNDLMKIKFEVLDNFDLEKISVDGVKRKDLNKLVFINIPNTEDPHRGTILVNKPQFIKHFRNGEDRNLNLGKGKKVLVRAKVWNQSLAMHEVFGLMGVEDSQYQVSSLLVWFFRKDFRSTMDTALGEVCQAAKEYAKLARSEFYGIQGRGEEANKHKAVLYIEMERAEWEMRELKDDIQAILETWGGDKYSEQYFNCQGSHTYIYGKRSRARNRWNLEYKVTYGELDSLDLLIRQTRENQRTD